MTTRLTEVYRTWLRTLNCETDEIDTIYLSEYRLRHSAFSQLPWDCQRWLKSNTDDAWEYRGSELMEKVMAFQGSKLRDTSLRMVGFGVEVVDISGLDLPGPLAEEIRHIWEEAIPEPDQKNIPDEMIERVCAGLERMYGKEKAEKTREELLKGRG